MRSVQEEPTRWRTNEYVDASSLRILVRSTRSVVLFQPLLLHVFRPYRKERQCDEGKNKR